MEMPEVFEYGGYGVNVKLTEMRDSKDVVWVRGNSFVVVDSPERGDFTLGLNGQRVQLVSINGIGEIRWNARAYDVVNALQYAAKGELNESWDCAMHLMAAKHFGLVIDLRAQLHLLAAHARCQQLQCLLQHVTQPQPFTETGRGLAGESLEVTGQRGHALQQAIDALQSIAHGFRPTAVE